MIKYKKMYIDSATMDLGWKHTYSGSGMEIYLWLIMRNIPTMDVGLKHTYVRCGMDRLANAKKLCSRQLVRQSQ